MTIKYVTKKESLHTLLRIVGWLITLLSNSYIYFQFVFDSSKTEGVIDDTYLSNTQTLPENLDPKYRYFLQCTVLQK